MGPWAVCIGSGRLRLFCQVEGSAQQSTSCFREAGERLITQLLVKFMQMLFEVSVLHLQSIAMDEGDLIVARDK